MGDLRESEHHLRDSAGITSSYPETAQDWCEATIFLFGWWDERRADDNKPLGMSRSQALVPANRATDSESFLNRLARSFHAAVESDFHFSSLNPVEVGIACIFEDNTTGLIGILRGLSLPIASAVAEIASLGKWLPPHQRMPFEMADLDMEDLEVLGMDSGAPDEVNGIKDTTLVHYAEQLAEIDAFSYLKDKAGVIRDGWELAIQVLGRMDSPEKSEEMVGKLIENLLEPSSGLGHDGRQDLETNDQPWHGPVCREGSRGKEAPDRYSSFSLANM